MKLATSLTLITCCLLLASCDPAPQSNCTIIDLRNHSLLPEEPIPLSEMAESVQLIFLETNDSVLISYIREIKIEREKLYVCATNGAFVFDVDGLFLNTVGANGRGPNEYLNLYGLFPSNDVVWIIDNVGKKVLKFRDSGAFLGSFVAEKRHTGYYHSGGDNFIGFIPDNGQSDTDIMLAFFNSTGMVDSILYRNPILQSNIAWGLTNEASFIQMGAQIKFKHVFNDTIYKIMDNKLMPEFVLNLGARKANENARAIAVNKDPQTYDIYEGMDVALLRGETDRYIFLKVENIPIFYDKKEQKVHKWKLLLPDDERLDSERSQKFVPMYIDKNGNLIGETVSVHEEDNPVIVVARLAL